MKKTNLTDKQKKRIEDKAYKKILKIMSKDTISNRKLKKQLKKIEKYKGTAHAKLTAEQILQPVSNAEFDKYVKDMGLMFQTAGEYAKKVKTNGEIH